MCMVDKQKQQSGFALLVSLIVVGAVLSIGLVILDLSIKQVRLASTTKDSEIAFHAANAGMECARFWRRDQNEQAITGADLVGVECFGVSVGDVADAGTATVDDNSDGDGYVYEYEMSWNGGESCTTITTVVAVASLTGDGVAIDNIRTLIPGYPEGDTLTCGAASQCTVVAVEGYNRPCAQKSGFGTIQREVLLEF